ncbi:tRNA uridine-5-carboxymethylaminomethyl(34) synthesis GTPase MnmE, partial [Afifella sp. IM 167]|uniref:tRNA uridine-5-carboxymethylaminomethyl(34) synthesis GTPase MnmE n=1 Tax=Afifella sp. IM 167 TaxID=2033586 RepID=UPI001CC9F26A
MDTIFALSSGALPAGVAVVRFSGAGSRQALEALAGSLPEPRRASLRTLRDSDGEAIDQALIVWMPGPSSFTGEDCAEIHCHGSRAVIARLVESVAERDGLRGAEPGEFARRAFLNGRIDLTEAEGLGDLIGAETEAQRRQALAQAGGAMAGQLASWRERLVGLLGEAEAGLDFADEADVAEGLSATFWKDLQSLADEIGEVLAGATFAERVREGFRIVIAGPPNAGKSTLLNAFARRDVAIVSPEAGTTRDLVSVELSLGGYPVTLVDTAGLRETPSEAESLGVARARKAAEAADLVLRLSEGRPHFGEGSESDWMVETKADVAGGPCGELGARRFRISAVTGVGLAEL